MMLSYDSYDFGILRYYNVESKKYEWAFGKGHVKLFLTDILEKLTLISLMEIIMNSRKSQ